MKLSKLFSAQVSGLQARIITIEVDLFKGFHTFTIVGLPDKAIEEARDRISSAIKNAGFISPKSKAQKVVISLAPADLKKEGPVFDVAMALGYLLAEGIVRFNTKDKLFLGELALSGELRPIRGALVLAAFARQMGFKEIYVPKDNAREAAFIEGIDVYGISTLQELVAHVDESRTNTQNSQMVSRNLSPEPLTIITQQAEGTDIDFSEIKGQETAKRGMEIAAAGGHNIALYGPPGTGKTMLARAFNALLPSLDQDEILEVTGIHSVAGILRESLVTRPQFRHPHHTASYVSIIGGGSTPKPGEVTLAHRGVLFMDEFPEFDKKVIESLRQPLEDGTVSISRAKGTEVFPSKFILIAAMNPCPCGYYGDSRKPCICNPAHLVKYQRKISGPIIDRVDLWIEAGNVEHKELSDTKTHGESTEVVSRRVALAREAQRMRFKESARKLKTNSEMNVRDLGEYINLSEPLKAILNQSATKLNLSARSYHRIIKLARTIADLDASADIEEKHLIEALQYRPRQMSAF